MTSYRVVWHFTNGKVLDQEKFYISDDTAIAAAKRRMRDSLPGEIAVLLRDGQEVARIHAGPWPALPR